MRKSQRKFRRNTRHFCPPRAMEPTGFAPVSSADFRAGNREPLRFYVPIFSRLISRFGHGPRRAAPCTPYHNARRASLYGAGCRFWEDSTNLCGIRRLAPFNPPHSARVKIIRNYFAKAWRFARAIYKTFREGSAKALHVSGRLFRNFAKRPVKSYDFLPGSTMWFRIILAAHNHGFGFAR